jgi:DNA-binding NtrC family response regulator
VARRRILIVDDEAGLRFAMKSFLECRGYEVDEAESCRAAEEAFRACRPDVAVIDFCLPDGDALHLMSRLKQADATVPLLILTAHGSIELAVQAIKEGAEQFLTKPLELPTLQITLERVLEHQRNRQKQLARTSRQARASVDPFLGTSPAIRQLAEEARKIMATERPVLILGETGTGKGVLANWLHNHSPRAEEPFVDLNCAGLSPEFLESELFGHEKGAYTGASATKPGLLEIAHRGTIFLDEIGDVSPEVQPKLLKVLEEQRFRRLGDVHDRRVDVRLISATHQDLRDLIRDKRFRSDLYFRISTIPLGVPALRERTEDIPVLARHMLQEFGAELGRGKVELSEEAEHTLRAYRWPGNIRELRNVLERALLLTEGNLLRPPALLFDAPPPEAAADDLTLSEVEQRHIERLLREERLRDEQGHVARAAARLGIPRSSLYQKIKKYGIEVSKI